jgi:hypothetical protein
MPNHLLREFREMKTIAELAAALDERGASLTLGQEVGDEEGDPDLWVAWLFSADTPSVIFSASDESLEKAIADTIEEWDADADSAPAETE